MRDPTDIARFSDSLRSPDNVRFTVLTDTCATPHRHCVLDRPCALSRGCALHWHRFDPIGIVCVADSPRSPYNVRFTDICAIPPTLCE